jgi:uncharacterized protein (DUF58 family)
LQAGQVSQGKQLRDTSEDKTAEIEGRSFTSRSAGYLFGKFGLLLVLVGLILATWYGQVVIVLLLCLVLSAAGLSKLWSRCSLAGVSCQRFLNVQRIFPGEQIELRLRLVNRKVLPLPWIQVDDEIPLGLSSDGLLGASDSPTSGFLSKTAALLWYTGISWKERLRGHKRGYYRIGPMRLTSGDIFGFYTRSITAPTTDHVIVYPRIYPMYQLGIASLFPLGETTAERRIFEDPLRIIGVRDYNPRDSLRYVHWKATAHRQELQVKVFEPTTTLKVAIFLAIDSFQGEEPENEEDFELGISTAASVANYLMERRSAVGLFANSCLADSGQPATLLPGSSADQLVEILEALAKVTSSSSGPFEDFLQVERSTLPWGTTLVFVISRPSPLLIELLVGLKEGGHKLVILQIGGAEENKIPTTLNRHRIRQPGDSSIVNAEEIR